MQCGLHTEMLAPWIFFSWVSNPSSLRGGVLGPPLLIGRKTAFWGFSHNFSFQGISARALWHHHHFCNVTAHAEHGWGWWWKSRRSSEDFQVLLWTGLGSHHNLLLFLEVPDPSQIPGTSNLSWDVPASSLSVSTCIFIESHEGANEALLVLEGPDPCSCWGLLMWLRLTHGRVAGSSL